MTNTEKRLEEFDKNFVSEVILDQEVRTVLPGLKLFIAESIAQTIAEERERVEEVEEKYQELIMAVDKKYEGETRHETALKYIRRAEKKDYGEAGLSSLDKTLPDKE